MATGIKIREVGSLVTYWDSRALKTHTGMIVEILPEDQWIMDYTIPVYRVMCGLGNIEQYTEAALRDFENNLQLLRRKNANKSA